MTSHRLRFFSIALSVLIGANTVCGVSAQAFGSPTDWFATDASVGSAAPSVPCATPSGERVACPLKGIAPTGAPTATPAGNDTSLQIFSANTDRAALWDDGSDSMTLTVGVGTTVTQVSGWDGGYDVLHADAEVGRFALFDDGTHGDKTAGDKRFTRSSVSAQNNHDIPLGIWIELASATGTTRSWDWPLTGIPVIDRSHERPVTILDGTSQMTDHVVNLTVGTDVYQPNAVWNKRNQPDLYKIARLFYRRFPDRFDFLSVYGPEDVPPGFFHTDARNDVRGIGKPIFDNTAAWGSHGKLRGVQFFGSDGSYALIHETLHQWGINLDGMGLSSGGHWTAVNVRGWLYGLDFTAVGNGRYQITWTPSDMESDHLTPFAELYLAGLAKAGEVPPITRIDGVDPGSVQTGDVVHPTSVHRFTIAKIVRRIGARKPSSGKAPHQFRMATVLFTVGRRASSAEMTLYDLILEQLSSHASGKEDSAFTWWPSWWYTTRGRSDMNTLIGNPR